MAGKGNTEVPTEDSDAGVDRALNRRIGLAVAAVFLVGLASFWAGTNDLARFGDVENWRTVEARVVGVTISEVGNPDYITYRDRNGRKRVADESVPRTVHVIGLDYEWTINGSTYHGSDDWGPYYERKFEAALKLKPKSVNVHYHPQTPSLNSITNPEEYRTSAWLPTIAGAVLMALSSGVAILFLWIHFSGWEPETSNGLGEVDPNETITLDDDEEDVDPSGTSALDLGEK